MHVTVYLCTFVISQDLQRYTPGHDKQTIAQRQEVRGWTVSHNHGWSLFLLMLDTWNISEWTRVWSESVTKNLQKLIWSVYVLLSSSILFVQPKHFPDCVASNVIDRSAAYNSWCFIVPTTAFTEQFNNSYFVKTITDWNQLNESQVHAETVEEFSHLSCSPQSLRFIICTHLPL